MSGMRQNLENAAKIDKCLQSEISLLCNDDNIFWVGATTLLDLHNGASAGVIHSRNDFISNRI